MVSTWFEIQNINQQISKQLQKISHNDREIGSIFFDFENYLLNDFHNHKYKKEILYNLYSRCVVLGYAEQDDGDLMYLLGYSYPMGEKQ